MNLKDFVRDAIVQIVEGVEEAREILKDRDVIINPAVQEDGKKVARISHNFRHRMVQTLTINAAITIEGKEGGKQGIGVLTGIFSAGVSQTQDEMNQTVTSLKFDVPLSLPYGGAAD